MAEEPLVRHIEYVDDYADFLDRDWIYVYPRQCGSGLQTKLQQAMALGLPVTAFPISFGGVGRESGDQCNVCRSHEEMAEWVETMLVKPAERCRIGLNAAPYVRSNFLSSE
jgi:glycosyltransferase involved in cell wall biosynthesis